MRNYLGLSLIHAFELRRVTMKRMLMAQGIVAVDLEAEAQVSPTWTFARSIHSLLPPSGYDLPFHVHLYVPNLLRTCLFCFP